MMILCVIRPTGNRVSTFTQLNRIQHVLKLLLVKM